MKWLQTSSCVTFCVNLKEQGSSGVKLEYKLLCFKAGMRLNRGGKPNSCGTFSPLSKCGICRLPVEQLPAKLIVLVAFCRIPDNELRLCSWKSASFPLFALASQVTQLPPPTPQRFSHRRDTLFLLLTDCLFVLLVVIKVHVLISSAQSYYNIITD